MKKIPLCLLIPLAVFGQEPKDSGHDAGPTVEAEFVASDIFRSGTLLIKVYKNIHLDGEYFGAPEYDLGITGVNYRLTWKSLSVSPGLAAGFGGSANTVPVFTVRWNLETHRWFSQGFFAQSLAEYHTSRKGNRLARAAESEASYSSVLDNNHISARIGPVEAGGLWEHIAYRDDNEWKGGVRLAVRIKEKYKLIFQCVGPGVEYRGGVAFEK